MKNWPWVIAALYGLLILALTLPVTLIAFYPAKEKLAQDVESIVMDYLKWWPYWVWLVVVILTQAALLIVPVRITNRHPVTKKAIIYPILAAALMMGILIAGAALSIHETILRDSLSEDMWWGALGILILSWILWGSIFRRWSKDLEPSNFIEKQCRYLFRGSILELLVAVPTHVLARYRDYCCAGFATFVGIGFGLAVMLFSFGPGIYFLYAERWKKIRPNSMTYGEGLQENCLRQ